MTCSGVTFPDSKRQGKNQKGNNEGNNYGQKEWYHFNKTASWLCTALPKDLMPGPMQASHPMLLQVHEVYLLGSRPEDCESKA